MLGNKVLFFLLTKTLEFHLVEPQYFLEQGLPKFKRALWGDKPEGLLPENCPNFSFLCLGRDPLGTCDKPLTCFKRGTTLTGF
jgi:hypothetical protein